MAEHTRQQLVERLLADPALGSSETFKRIREKASKLADLLLSEAEGDALRALGLLSLLREDAPIQETPNKERREAATHEQT